MTQRGSGQTFNGVVLPIGPGISFKGMTFDEDTAINPRRVPQVTRAVCGLVVIQEPTSDCSSGV